MPGTFRSKNGATLSGHSDKWSDKNRSANSHDAGQGSRGKRNQGTGIQGKQNTLPSDAIDTSKMNPDEKLKYFKSLGLMPGKGVTPAQPKEVPPAEPKRNQVQELSNNLGQIFKSQPQLLQDIVKQLQSVPKENFKQKVVDVLKVMQDNTSTNPQEIHGAIMSVLNNDAPVSDFDFIKDFFHAAGKDDRKRPDDVEGLLGRFIERSENDPAKIAKAKAALEELNKTYVPGEQSKYIAGMNAAFGALN